MRLTNILCPGKYVAVTLPPLFGTYYSGAGCGDNDNDSTQTTTESTTLSNPVDEPFFYFSQTKTITNHIMISFHADSLATSNIITISMETESKTYIQGSPMEGVVALKLRQSITE